MIHARIDYNHIQDIAEIKIKADEPVFLLRAKDKLAPMVTRHWANMLEQRDGDANMIQMVRNHANLMEKWQEKNGCKLPDFDPSHLEIVPDFILRLQVERVELQTRMEKLNKFIASKQFESIDEEMQNLLHKQSHFMFEYFNILDNRIFILNSKLRDENNSSA